MENGTTMDHNQAQNGALEQNGTLDRGKRDVRPDPTIDLHWSSFAGPIQDIFSRNATSHPERICVTETASPNSRERQFTYRQIHEASNVLSHKLIESGVQRYVNLKREGDGEGVGRDRRLTGKLGAMW